MRHSIFSAGFPHRSLPQLMALVSEPDWATPAGTDNAYTGDVVVCADNTKFVTAFSAIGLSGDGGGTWRLPGLIGPRRAAVTYLRNTPISAPEAQDWGLLTRSSQAANSDNAPPESHENWPQVRGLPSPACKLYWLESWSNDLCSQLDAEV